jgi:hypothetical protein
MTVTIKKVGEAAASKVLQSASAATAARAAGGTITPTREVGFRAVTKEEAPHMIPAKESSKASMMPWRGWVSRLAQDRLDPNTYKSLKDFFYFWPEDPHNLHQSPYPSTRIVISADGKETAAYREVSPGSQPPVDIPRDDLDADPYDSGYFKRDTRRRYVDPEFPHSDVEMLKLDMQDPNDPEVMEAKKKLAAGPPSSPGNGGRFATGPSDFDPTGLRAVMAVNNASLFKELDKHMPDHVSRNHRGLVRARMGDLDAPLAFVSRTEPG